MGSFEEEPKPFQVDGSDKPVLRAKARMGPAGRVVIPAGIRTAMGLKEGDMLVATFADGELKLVTVPEAVRRAQTLVRKFIPEDVKLVDEFLAERRKMWGEDD